MTRWFFAFARKPTAKKIALWTQTLLAWPDIEMLFQNTRVKRALSRKQVGEKR